MQRADIRVVQSRDSSRLALEPAAELCTRDLDRHQPAEASVTPFIDLSHATCAEGLDDLIGAQTMPGG